MAEIKWIKIVVDMFEDSKIEFIRSLPEGDSILVTWIQMMSIAGQSNMGGYLMVTDDLPYSEQFLASKLKRSPVFLQFALDTLCKLKMVNIEDGPYHITNWEKYQNVDGMEKIKLQNKERKRLQRERKKQELLPMSRDGHVTGHANVTVDVTPCHATDIDIELDKEKDIKHIVVSNESDIALAFNTFWDAYPTKGSNKKMSAEKWKLLWRDKKINMDEMLMGVTDYVNYQNHHGYKTCAAQVFLNQERWKVDWTVTPSIHQPVQNYSYSTKDREAELLQKAIQNSKSGQVSMIDFGPRTD